MTQSKGSTATFSSDRVYRYTLTRVLTDSPQPRKIVWIMLNPSTADDTEDDPTIRRILGFSRKWGFDRLDVVNLFAFRATDPKDMLKASDPVGPDNDRIILEVTEWADLIVGAWGNHGNYRSRAYQITQLLKACHLDIWCLGCTQSGQPKHPLYLAERLEPIPYIPRT